MRWEAEEKVVFLRVSALQILFGFDFLFLTVLNISRMSSGLL